MTPTATGDGSELSEHEYSTYQPAYLAVDLETTGLHSEVDRILEVAWTALDLHFNQTQPIRRMVIRAGRVTRFLLEQNQTVLQMHVASGLYAEACESDAGASQTDVEDEILATMPVRDDGKPLVIFGSSVHFDKAFLERQMPRVHERLHYRVADVSTMLAFATAAGIPWPTEQPIAHRAYDDIAWSISAAQYLRDYVRGIRAELGLVSAEEGRAARPCRGCEWDKNNPAFPLAGPEHTCGKTRERIQR